MITSQNPRILYGITAAILLICLAVGFWLAANKPLWGDEIRSQTVAVEKLSVAQILSGRHIRFSEGNICPTFYLFQKGLCGLFGHRIPQPIEENYVEDFNSQIL